MSAPAKEDYTVVRVERDHILASDRMRDVDESKVAELKASIEAIGLLNPIIVSPRMANGWFNLVAGLHRLHAIATLGWTEVPAIVLDLNEAQAQLAQIDENLVRSELDDLERAQHHAKRKELLEALGKVRGHGGNRSTGQLGHLPSYARAASEVTGQSERAVRRDVHRAENIAPDVQDAIAGTPAANHGAFLDRLAKLDHEEQRQAIKDREHVAVNTKETAAEVMSKISKRMTHDGDKLARDIQWTRQYFELADEDREALVMFLRSYEERVASYRKLFDQAGSRPDEVGQ